MSIANCFILFGRVQAQVQASDVLLTSIENNADGGIDIITYVQLLGGNLVLSLQVLLQAIEVITNLCRLNAN